MGTIAELSSRVIAAEGASAVRESAARRLMALALDLMNYRAKKTDGSFTHERYADARLALAEVEQLVGPQLCREALGKAASHRLAEAEGCQDWSLAAREREGEAERRAVLASLGGQGVDHTQVWAELEMVRGEVRGEVDRVGRMRLAGTRLNPHTRSGGSAGPQLATALADVGLDGVKERIRWALREVAAGRRDPGLHANTFIGAGWGALCQQYAQAQTKAEEAKALAVERQAEEARRGPELSHEARTALVDSVRPSFMGEGAGA